MRWRMPELQPASDVLRQLCLPLSVLFRPHQFGHAGLVVPFKLFELHLRLQSGSSLLANEPCPFEGLPYISGPLHGVRLRGGGGELGGRPYPSFVVPPSPAPASG